MTSAGNVRRFPLVLSIVALSVSAYGERTAIRLDQIGYTPRSTKVAFVVSDSPADTFTVHRLPEGDVVHEGDLSAPRAAPDSRERTRAADFSSLTTTGTYELRVDGAGRSTSFQIREAPYRELLRLTSRSFYGQRCGVEVDLAPTSPSFTHGACHLSEAYHPSSGAEGIRDATGGWHDAGDYGRYVVNSGISTGTLLWAWELFPEAFRDLDLETPDSGDDTPDLLDEVRWNLEWMMSMQDGDGGVWHKQTSEAFAPIVAPEDDKTVSFVIGTGTEPFKSTCATGSFAAAMAIATRVYEPFDPAFSKRAAEAAARAWQWLGPHADVPFRNPQGITTGEYGDDDCSDERMWAAAEIFRTTRGSAVGEWFVAHASGVMGSIVDGDPPDWRDVGALAAWTYAMSGHGDPQIVSLIRKRSIRAADEIVARARRHGYLIPLETDDYVWGSNGVAANYGLQLLIAYELKDDATYVDAAFEIVHYLTGRNPLAISWVTGTGSRSAMNPHHRPSMADDIDAPWPGLLVGGPNRTRQDTAMETLPAGTPPGRMYLDREESFATNEVAINWNAALVFLLAGISK